MLIFLRALATSLRKGLKAFVALAFVALIALNIATITIGSVYDALSSVVWQVGSMVWDTMPAPKQSRAALEADRDELKKRTLDVEADNARLKHETKDLRAELDLADTKASKQADEIKNLRLRSNQLNDELTGALGAAKKAEQALLTQRAQLHAAADLTDDIARRSAKAVTRNTISLPAEAVPVIGIATVIAVTAWDVADLCSTMNDMAAIKSALRSDTGQSDTWNAETNKYCGRTADDLKGLFLDFSKQSANQSCAELRKLFPTEDLTVCEDLPLPALPKLEAKKEKLPPPTIPDYD